MMHPESTPKSHEDAATKRAFLPAFERLALPALIFGLLFFMATFGITMLLTPDRFPVRIGDRVVRLIDLETEQRALLVEKVELETNHDVSLDSRAPVLRQLAMLKPRVTPVGAALLAIDDVRLRFRTPTVDPISLPRVFVASGTVIRIGGEVRDMGGSTMRTLASFVDGLRTIPFVLSVSEPEYSERKDADGTTVSPFVITLTLPHVGF